MSFIYLVLSEEMGKPRLKPSNIITRVANHVTSTPLRRLTIDKSNAYGIKTWATFEILKLPK